MTEPAADALRQAESILDDFEAFLLSDQVFWPRSRPGSQANRYDLSLGQALLACDSLYAYARVPSAEGESARLNEAAQRITTILQRWAAAASRKAEAELPQRLSLWQAYLEEARHSQASPREYAHQVRNRVIAERLMPLAKAAPEDLAERMGLLDRALRPIFIEGPFTWQAPLSLAYPQPQFWFLYGSLQVPPD